MSDPTGSRPAARRSYAEEVLEQRAAFLMGAISNKLVSSGSAIYRRNFGIGFTEWRVMVMLALEPEVPARRICDVVGLDKAAISRGIKALETAGLIEPTVATADRRSRAYVLTPAGHAAYERILAVSREHERRLLAGLEPQEIPILIDMLRRMLAQMPGIEAFTPERV